MFIKGTYRDIESFKVPFFTAIPAKFGNAWGVQSIRTWGARRAVNIQGTPWAHLGHTLAHPGHTLAHPGTPRAHQHTALAATACREPALPSTGRRIHPETLLEPVGLENPSAGISPTQHCQGHRQRPQVPPHLHGL